MRFRDNIAVVTGAASGIGLATSLIIADEGGIAVVVDNDAPRVEQVVGAIRAKGGKAYGTVVDVTQVSEVSQAVKTVAERHHRIDILVNSVGGSTIVQDPSAGVDVMSLKEWQDVLNFNLTGMFLFCHAIAPMMMRQRSGKIVNVSSIAARGLGASSNSAYAAAKGGVTAFTRKLSVELGPFGINVNAIAPGTTLSPRVRKKWDALSDEEREARLLSVPLRKVSQPDDQARVIAFLASRDADLITGTTIDVAGGL